MSKLSANNFELQNWKYVYCNRVCSKFVIHCIIQPPKIFVLSQFKWHNLTHADKENSANITKDDSLERDNEILREDNILDNEDNDLMNEGDILDNGDNLTTESSTKTLGIFT